MEKRNLIIGGFTNYGINQLKPWVLSAKEVATHNTDIVLVYGNTTQQTLDWLQEQGVLLWPMDQLPYVPPHVMRFHSLYEFMITQISAANHQNDPQLIDDVIDIIREIKSAWDQIPTEFHNLTAAEVGI